MTREVRALLLATLALFLSIAPAGAADPAAVRQAVERGVAALRKIQLAEGNWPRGEVGGTALAALTLLECDVPANDPSVQKAAAVVRRASFQMTDTYSLALAILFFDRLGEPADVPLIQILAVRLLSGQGASGGWTYTCGTQINEGEARRLEALVKQLGRDDKRDRRVLPREVQQQLALAQRPPPADPLSHGDNSNTQFAVLALWVAHRYGIPIESAAARIDRRFRASQNPDGGWGYLFGNPGVQRSTPAMTCAALLGLAVGHGTAKEAARGKAVRDLDKDPAVRAGLMAVGTSIDHPVAKKAGKPRVAAVTNDRFYYFLWSLERVGVIYGLETIGSKDWYGWGAEILLASQQPDGHWMGEYRLGGADTCFALLFLRRANPARDLSAALQGVVQDPGEVVLRVGGLDGSKLQQPNLPSALEPTKPGSGSSSSSAKEPQEKPPAVDPEVGRLTARLVEARGERQDEVLAQLRDGKGVVYTQALAAASRQLTGDAKVKAREALARRLTRMSSETLGDKLEDDDLEVRRAATLALAMKDDKAHVRKLIDLLDDREPPVVRAAHVALKSLTGQDFGPTPDASRAEHARAVAAWKAWWGKQK